jgi:hypothetical protein
MRWLLELFWIQAGRGERKSEREILWESGIGQAKIWSCKTPESFL